MSLMQMRISRNIFSAKNEVLAVGLDRQCAAPAPAAALSRFCERLLPWLVLPALLLNSGDEASKATELGLVTFLGLLAGMAWSLLQATQKGQSTGGGSAP